MFGQSATTFGSGTSQPAGSTGFTFGSAPSQPGGTSAAPGGFSFGSTSTPFSFGTSTATTQPASTGFSFGGASTGTSTSTSTATSQPATSGFSFGGTATSTPAFGTSIATSTPAFGTSIATSTPAFGTSTATSTPAFGTSTATPQPASGGFTFGTPASTATTSQPYSLSFGQPAASTAASAPTLSFGTSTGTSAAATKSASSAGFSFGAPATTTARSKTATGFSFGATSTAPTASTTTTAPQTTQLNPQSVTKQTKYAELTDDAKRQLDELEQYISSQIKTSDYIASQLKITGTDVIGKVTTQTQELAGRLESINNALDRDTFLIGEVRKSVNEHLKTVEVAGRIVETYQAAGSRYMGTYTVHDNYFNKVAQEFEHRLEQYQRTIEELERHLSSLSQEHRNSPQALADIMRSQHESLLIITGKVAMLHEQVQEQKEDYKQFRKEVYGDERDPFTAKRQKADASTPSTWNKIATDMLKPVVQR